MRQCYLGLNDGLGPYCGSINPFCTGAHFYHEFCVWLDLIDIRNGLWMSEDELPDSVLF